MACNHSGSCELFPLMAMEPALNLWKKHFCDGSFNCCARYQLSLNSKPVPLTLLPNGKQLAPRSREQINAADALAHAADLGRYDRPCPIYSNVSSDRSTNDPRDTPL